MKSWWWIFAAGYLANGALHSLVQDYYGMERYIQIESAAWMPAEHTVPLALFQLLVSILLIINNR
jgi:hypothetical protein